MNKDKITLIRMYCKGKDYLAFHNSLSYSNTEIETAFTCSNKTVYNMFLESVSNNEIKCEDVDNDNDSFMEFINYSYIAKTFDIKELGLKIGKIYGYYINNIRYFNGNTDYDIFYISNKFFNNSLELLKYLEYDVEYSSELVVETFNTNDFRYYKEFEPISEEKEYEELSECDLNNITLLQFTYEDNEIGDIVHKIGFSSKYPKEGMASYLEYAKTCTNQEIYKAFHKFNIDDEESFKDFLGGEPYMRTETITLNDLEVKENDIIYGYCIPYVLHNNEVYGHEVMCISTKKYNDSKSLLNVIDKDYKDIFSCSEMLITETHLNELKYIK